MNPWIPLTMVASFAMIVGLTGCQAQSEAEDNPRAEQPSADDPYAGAVQISKDGTIILYLRKNEIVKDGSVVGTFDGNQVRRDGSVVGEIRDDLFRHEGSDVWKLDKGNLYQGIEVRLEGSIIGDIRSDGKIYLEGSHWGQINPYQGKRPETMRALAALYYFSDYFHSP